MLWVFLSPRNSDHTPLTQQRRCPLGYKTDFCLPFTDFFHYCLYIYFYHNNVDMNKEEDQTGQLQ